MLVEAAQARGTVTYGDVSVRVFGGRVPARSRYIMDLLAEVDEEEQRSRGIIIASLVVRADSGIPGAGYFTFLARRFGRDVASPEAAWRIEAERVWAAFSAGEGAGAGQLLGETADLLAGGRSGLSSALTWVPAELLRERGRAEAESLVQLAVKLGVRLVFVPGNAGWAGEAVGLLAEQGIAAAWVVDGILGLVAAELGWSVALAATAAAGGEVFNEYASGVVEIARSRSAAGLAAGATAVVVADDVAGARGPLVAPDFITARLAPYYAEIASAWAERGRPAIFHSDGDISWLYPRLASDGFSAVHVAGEDASPTVTWGKAVDAGLCPIGGIRAAAFSGGDVNTAVLRARQALSAPGLARAFVADDGAISTRQELDILVDVLKALDMPTTFCG